MTEQPITGCEWGAVALDPLLLRAGEVAVMFGIGRTKVYELMEAQVLPVVRIGTAVRVPRQRLQEWIEQNTTGG